LFPFCFAGEPPVKTLSSVTHEILYHTSKLKVKFEEPVTSTSAQGGPYDRDLRTRPLQYTVCTHSACMIAAACSGMHYRHQHMTSKAEASQTTDGVVGKRGAACARLSGGVPIVTQACQPRLLCWWSGQSPSYTYVARCRKEAAAKSPWERGLSPAVSRPRSSA